MGQQLLDIIAYDVGVGHGRVFNPQMRVLYQNALTELVKTLPNK